MLAQARWMSVPLLAARNGAVVRLGLGMHVHVLLAVAAVRESEAHT